MSYFKRRNCSLNDKFSVDKAKKWILDYDILVNIFKISIKMRNCVDLY